MKDEKNSYGVSVFVYEFVCAFCGRIEESMMFFSGRKPRYGVV
jgi:hypothetical protein